MSTQTPDDPPPYVMGPGPDYDPPPVDTLIDPAVRDETATKGPRSYGRCWRRSAAW